MRELTEDRGEVKEERCKQGDESRNRKVGEGSGEMSVSRKDIGEEVEDCEW